MSDDGGTTGRGRSSGPLTAALVALGGAFVALVVLGTVVGLVRGDVAGTLGSVVSVGMGVTAVVIVLVLALRRGSPH